METVDIRVYVWYNKTTKSVSTKEDAMNNVIETNTPNNSRILYLTGYVCDENTSEICNQILMWNMADREGMAKFRDYTIKPIQLYIQTTGGSAYDMLALIDVIETSDTPVITYCTGYAMSAGAMIFLAGHLRKMYPMSYLMLHQMSAGTCGKENDLHIQQDQLDDMHKMMIKYIKKHTNLPKEFYKKFDKLKEDVYFKPEECLKYGICDEIIETADWRSALLEQKKLEDQEEADDCCED